MAVNQAKVTIPCRRTGSLPQAYLDVVALRLPTVAFAIEYVPPEAKETNMNMKTCLLKYTLIALVGAGALGISTAHAVSPNAAIVLKALDHPSGCFGFVPGSLVPLSTMDEIHTTATSSGNVKLTCHFYIPDGFEPAAAVKATGFDCGIFLPTGTAFTTDSKIIASPGGRATLTCQIKANQL